MVGHGDDLPARVLDHAALGGGDIQIRCRQARSQAKPVNAQKDFASIDLPYLFHGDGTRQGMCFR